MGKLIPILPCDNIQALAKFYQDLGFELVQLYTRPNPYAVLKYGEMEMHFFGNKKFIPSENPSMCILQMDDVDKACEDFTSNLKKAYGKIPRSGIPKITKVRHLAGDRRFTLTDTGGNTIYVVTPNEDGADIAFRSLEDETYAKSFTVLYDIIYSKEDQKAAANMLSKLIHIKECLNDCDLAKFLLVELEILGLPESDASANVLKQLIGSHKDENTFWKEADKRFAQLLHVE